MLELGSELISSDIIAFYELAKNAFDAGSKNGVEVRFSVVLRRNAYLRVRASAVAVQRADGESRSAFAKRMAGELERLKGELAAVLDVSAGSNAVSACLQAVSGSTDISRFIDGLDQAYRMLSTLEISDTGSGMSLQDLTDNYLVIGTASRKREVDRAVLMKNAKVPFLGEKGIGRLSAMRLGQRLLVSSARAQDSRLNTLNIDWSRFGDLEAMLEDIDLTPEKGDRKVSAGWSGTRLTIGDLTEDWTEARLKSMAEYDFARLIDPFIDPKRRPRIALFWNGTRVSIPWMDRALLDHAHAKLKGEFTFEKGEPVLRCTLEAIDLGFPHPREIDSVELTLPDLESVVIGTSGVIPVSALASLGPFDFEAFWYNRRRLVSIESIGDQRAVRELQKKWSGILLFRDGFRVFPYGDDDDDWLALDRKALGRPGYTLNKNQFVGHVAISRSANPDLVDQTNREGLRASPEQEVFIGLLQHIIQGLLWHFLRDVEKSHKQQPIDLRDVKGEVSRLESRAKIALTRIRKLVPKDDVEIVDDLQHAFLEFQELAERATKRITEVEEDSRQMVQMAGVGLMVEVVAHELARSSENALETLEGLRGKEVSVEVLARLDTLRAEMKSVSKRLRVLDPLSISGRQRSEVFDLGDLIEDLREGHAAQFRRHRIKFNIEKPSEKIRIRAVKGMIVQILENMIANSVYWMDLRAARESRYVPTISLRIETTPVTLYFSDNGHGIAEENREKVFRPFWSLKEKTKRRGLGLFIARECATYLGGSLALSSQVDPKTKRLHEFVLELPDAASVR